MNHHANYRLKSSFYKSQQQVESGLPLQVNILEVKSDINSANQLFMESNYWFRCPSMTASPLILPPTVSCSYLALEICFEESISLTNPFLPAKRQQT